MSLLSEFLTDFSVNVILPSRVGKRRNTVTFHVFDDPYAPFVHAVIRQYPQIQFHCSPSLTDKRHF